MRRSLSLKAAALRLVMRLTEMVTVPCAWKVWALLGSDSCVRSSEIACVQVSLKSRSTARPEGAAGDRGVGGRGAVVEAHAVRAHVAAGEPVAEAMIELEAPPRAGTCPRSDRAPSPPCSRPAAGSTASPGSGSAGRCRGRCRTARSRPCGRRRCSCRCRSPPRAPSSASPTCPCRGRRRRTRATAGPGRNPPRSCRSPPRSRARAARGAGPPRRASPSTRSSGRASQIRRTARC